MGPSAFYFKEVGMDILLITLAFVVFIIFCAWCIGWSIEQEEKLNHPENMRICKDRRRYHKAEQCPLCKEDYYSRYPLVNCCDHIGLNKV